MTNTNQSSSTPRFGQRREPVNAPVGSRVFTLRQLPLKGIDYSRNHLRRLWQSGKFPRPIYLSARKPVWTEESIDSWVAEKIAEQVAKTEAK